jgi:O-antigen ligase
VLRLGDFYRFMLLLLIVVIFTRVHVYLGLAALRPALLLAITCGAWAILKPSSINLRALRTWPAVTMGLLGAMACLSVPFGMSIGGSAAFIFSTYAKTLLFGFLVLVSIRNTRDLRFLAWAFSLTCGLLAVVALFVARISKTTGMMTYDANDVGLILTVGIPVTLICYYTSEGRLRLLAIATLVGIGATLAVSQSRGGFIGLAVVLLALLAVSKEPLAKKVAAVAVVAGAVVLFAPSGYWELMSSMVRPTEDYNWTAEYGRRNVWRRGVEYMLDNPASGIGVGNFPRAEGTISDVAQGFMDPKTQRIKWSAAHNSFIQIGAEMGLPGLALFCTLVFGGIVSLGRLRRRLPGHWSIPSHLAIGILGCRLLPVLCLP